MATITFTTRATNKTASLPAEEAIERLFADASGYHRLSKVRPTSL